MPSPFRLIQISDCHLFADTTKTGYAAINPHTCLQAVFAAVRSHQPDAIVVSGDVSGDDSEHSYRHFKNLWQGANIQAPLYGLMGNHDHVEYWSMAFNTAASHYSASFNNHWHLHVLPCQFEGTRGHLSASDIALISKDIASMPDKFHILALHHPLTNAHVWMDRHALFNPELGVALAQSNSAPTMIIHGHVHTAREVELGHTTQLACPSTCWQWGNTEAFSVADLPPGFRILDLYDNGHWETQIYYLHKESMQ